MEAKIAVKVPWVTLSDKGPQHLKERVNLNRGYLQQKTKNQRIKRNYQKLLDWWFSNLAEI